MSQKRKTTKRKTSTKRKAKKKKASTPAPMTLADYARRRKVSRSKVTEAIKSGRLSKSVGKNARGGPCILDPKVADKEWVDNVKGQKGDAKTDSLANWQRLLTEQKTRAATLANDEKEGSLVPFELVTRDAFEDGRMIREAMLNLPDRIAGELAAMSSEAKVHARLDKEIRIALEGTSAALTGRKPTSRKTRTG